jgi:hypothetical protein
MFSNIKIKILSGILIIIFYTIITYLLPDKEWGLNDFNVFERLLYCTNIQIGTFGFIDDNIYPKTNRAKFILFLQRITSYIFRIILII